MRCIMLAKKNKVMEDKGPWQFTEEQIEKIKNKDIEAITKFYNDNYRIIYFMAKKFVRNRKNMGNYSYIVDDLLQQVFVDIPYYDFSTRAGLYYCIVKGSFLRCDFGGVLYAQEKFIPDAKILSIDAPKNDRSNSYYLIDRYSTFEDPLEVLDSVQEREQKDEQIIAFLEKTIKNKKDLNKMFCQIFTDIPLSQIKGDEYGCYKQCKSKNL